MPGSRHDATRQEVRSVQHMWKRFRAAAVCTIALVSLALGAALALQETPPGATPAAAPKIIRGESSRGVSLAIKDAVDKVEVAGDATKHFRVVSITGQKARKYEKVVVELEVQDKPFDPSLPRAR